MISEARSITILPDSSILLRDSRPPYIHLLDRAGRPLRSFVDYGGGPAHALDPQASGFLGGQVWLWDFGARRLSFFDLQGRLRRELPIRLDGVVIPISANRLLHYPSIGYSPGADSIRSITVNAIDSLGRTVGRRFGFTGVIPTLSIPTSGGKFIVGAQPYMRGPSPALFPHGQGLAIGFPNVERRSGGAAFHLVRIGDDGRTLFDGWVHVPGVRTTSADLDRAVTFLSTGPAAREPGHAGRVRQAVRVPDYLPAFSVGLVGPGGETWLREFALGRGGRAWYVVGASGVVLGRVLLPQEAQLVSIAPDGRLVVRSETEDGEPILELYRVVRR